MTDGSVNLYEFTRDELTAWVSEGGLNPVHAGRLWNYLYCEAASSFEEMPELPPRLQARLRADARLGHLPVAAEAHSTDGFTRKYLLRLADQQRIETVLMRFTGRMTACVSSQAGCAMGCVFCATGQRGFSRHLSAGEIVGQILHVARVLKSSGERLRNVVLMGMGEPLHNYDAVMKAGDILRDQNGFALGARKITVSTVGVVPGIVRMADEGRPFHLAVSLHAATQDKREALVPVAKRWPLQELLEACRYYVRKQERRIFFEWALIEGENDSAEQARALGQLLQGMPAQVNLIPLNPTAGYEGIPGASVAAKQFQSVLAGFGLPSTVRQRRGLDIAAGCGQLDARESGRG